MTDSGSPRRRLRSVRKDETATSIERSRRRRDWLERSAVFGAAAVAASVVGAVFVFAVLPARAWQDEQDEADERQTRLVEVTEQRDRLQTQIEDLQTPEGIEAEARGQYQLVAPGEETFVIVTTTTVAPPPTAVSEAIPALPGTTVAAP